MGPWVLIRESWYECLFQCLAAWGIAGRIGGFDPCGLCLAEALHFKCGMIKLGGNGGQYRLERPTEITMSRFFGAKIKTGFFHYDPQAAPSCQLFAIRLRP
jgi:hypothetical protein